MECADFVRAEHGLFHAHALHFPANYGRHSSTAFASGSVLSSKVGGYIAVVCFCESSLGNPGARFLADVSTSTHLRAC